jgi:hypothetical protein
MCMCVYNTRNVLDIKSNLDFRLTKIDEVLVLLEFTMYWKTQKSDQ